MHTLYADGGQSPSLGCYGSFLLEKDGKQIHLVRLTLGDDIFTNNMAEYATAIAGLEFCKSRGIREVHLYSDSLLLVRQVSGQWKVGKQHLRRFVEKIHELCEYFYVIEIEHIDRSVIVKKLGH